MERCRETLGFLRSEYVLVTEVSMRLFYPPSEIDNDFRESNCQQIVLELNHDVSECIIQLCAIILYFIINVLILTFQLSPEK